MSSQQNGSFWRTLFAVTVPLLVSLIVYYFTERISIESRLTKIETQLEEINRVLLIKDGPK